MRLKGQVALVTGRGTGIGRGISLAFPREGGHVAANCSKPREKAENAIRPTSAAGGQAIALQAELSGRQ